MAARSFASWRRAKRGSDPCEEDAGRDSCAERLSAQQIVEGCRLDDETERFVCTVAEANKMSGRALMSLLKVSRTISDMDESEKVRAEHVAEALCFKLANGLGEVA